MADLRKGSAVARVRRCVVVCGAARVWKGAVVSVFCGCGGMVGV